MRSRKTQRQFPGISSYLDRHGKRRWRYRKNGASFELGADYGSENFRKRFEAAVAGQKGSNSKSETRYSFNNLAKTYYQSAAFANMSTATKSKRRRMLDDFLAEHGTNSVKKIRRVHIRAILDAKRETPTTANVLRGLLIGLLELALDLEWRSDNPARSIKRYPVQKRAIHTWTEAEIDTFLEHHPKGSVAHTAMTLMLFTGAAAVDAVQLGPKNISDGRLRYQRQKTCNSGCVVIDIPLHPELSAKLEGDIANGIKTFLQLSNGKQRSAKGLVNSFRGWFDNAGLPHCSSHGLRKAIARRIAEAGGTPHEIMSITGHRDLEMVTHYAAEANREGLADQAMDLLQ